MEVEIYSGIEFTRFHQGPIFSPFSPLKNTWCKLTLASRERAKGGRKEMGKKGKGIGQREGRRHEKRKFQGLL